LDDAAIDQGRMGAREPGVWLLMAVLPIFIFPTSVFSLICTGRNGKVTGEMRAVHEKLKGWKRFIC
jgi:hypothetical protein